MMSSPACDGSASTPRRCVTSFRISSPSSGTERNAEGAGQLTQGFPSLRLGNADRARGEHQENARRLANHFQGERPGSGVQPVRILDNDDEPGRIR